jgi:hypothetical protein
MRATLFSMALLPLLACAQSWCPPGATWTHEYADVMGGYFGVQRVEYAGDTMVGGYLAQELRQTHVVAPWGTTNYASYSTASLITRSENDLVYIWDGVSEYDTLFWFGASPGERWNAPGWSDDSDIALTVLDTATVLIQGNPLRRLAVGFMQGWPIDTLYERIGFSHDYLNGWSWFLLDMPWNGLMCYSDQDIDFVAPGVTDCGYTLSVPNDPRVLDASPIPNPGTTHFTLDLPPGPHTITLFDATGRMVLRQRTSGERPMIATEALPAGLYRIAVRDEQGAVMGVTWVKK